MCAKAEDGPIASVKKSVPAKLLTHKEGAWSYCSGYAKKGWPTGLKVCLCPPPPRPHTKHSAPL